GMTPLTVTSDTTISMGRRYYRVGGAVAATAFLAIVGTGIAIAAVNSRRDYYDSYGYYDSPGYYYGGGPVYYGGGPAYYGGYYGGSSYGYGGYGYKGQGYYGGW